MPCASRRRHQAVARIAHPGSTCIGRIRDIVSAVENLHNATGGVLFIVTTAADQGFVDVQVTQELCRSPGVLARNGMAMLEDVNGAEGYVAEVSNGSCYDVEAGHASIVARTAWLIPGDSVSNILLI